MACSRNEKINSSAIQTHNCNYNLLQWRRHLFLNIWIARKLISDKKDHTYLTLFLITRSFRVVVRQHRDCTGSTGRCIRGHSFGALIALFSLASSISFSRENWRALPPCISPFANMSGIFTIWSIRCSEHRRISIRITVDQRKYRQDLISRKMWSTDTASASRFTSFTIWSSDFFALHSKDTIVLDCFIFVPRVCHLNSGFVSYKILLNGTPRAFIIHRDELHRVPRYI